MVEGRQNTRLAYPTQQHMKKEVQGYTHQNRGLGEGVEGIGAGRYCTVPRHAFLVMLCLFSEARKPAAAACWRGGGK